MKYDKFDDVVWKKQVKTLISLTDTTIVVETKGQNPKEYRYIKDDLFIWNNGKEDSLVCVAGDLYGYETTYPIVSEDIIAETIQETKDDYIHQEDKDSLYNNFLMQLMFFDKLLAKTPKMPSITFRTISKFRYTYEYGGSVAWIKFPDGSRIIYDK